jgi:hypothetical protein
MKVGKDYKEVASQVLQCTLSSYYNWDNQNRPIIQLLEKYFSKSDLEEFLEFGAIKKFENIKNDNDLFIEYVKYNLLEKLDRIFATKGKGIFEKANKYIPKEIFKSILHDLQKDPMFEMQQRDSKKVMINRIKGYESSLLEKPSQSQLIDIIENNLSNIECYVLIKYYEEF